MNETNKKSSIWYEYKIPTQTHQKYQKLSNFLGLIYINFITLFRKSAGKISRFSQQTSKTLKSVGLLY